MERKISLKFIQPFYNKESENTTNVDIFKFLSSPREWIEQYPRYLPQRCDSPLLLKMLEEGIHTDITLTAQGGSVKAHRSVLASASPVFNAMFQHNMKEQLTSTVDIPDMTIDGLQLFLLLLYTTNSLTCTEKCETLADLVSDAIDKHFTEFWGAVHMYQVVPILKNVLQCALQRNLTLDNCWDYFDSSLQVDGASSICCKYILKNYDNVIESERFLKEMRCNPQQVQSILKKTMKYTNF